MLIRKEIHTRCRFSYEQAEKWLPKILGYSRGGNILTCKATLKYLKARRVYIHYTNEYQRLTKLSFTK